MPRSRPWIRTLVRDGLLDVPEIRGIPGHRGGRREGTWPAEQFELFLLLLELLPKGVPRKSLCDVPVGVWLDRGSGHVPVRQVRRALRASRLQPSKRAARDTGRFLAELFAGGHDLNRQDASELIDAFVNVAITGILDRSALLEAARRVIDPENIGREVGPLGPWIGPEGLVYMIQALLTAIERLDQLADDTFEQARSISPQVTTMYADLQPTLAADREVGAVFQEMTPERFGQDVCRSVLLTLGVLELNRQGSIPHSLPPIDTSSPGADTFATSGPPTKSPPRPRQRPGGTAPGKATSACNPTLPSP
jgi:hypothetical protein